MRGIDGGKLRRRLSEVNARPVSRGKNEFICKFKMVAGDMVSIRGRLWSTHNNVIYYSLRLRWTKY